MTSHDLLSEKIENLKADLERHREETRADRKEMRKDIRELDQEIETVRAGQSALNITMGYVKQTVENMDKTLKTMAEAQRSETTKNTLLVSILQVGGGIAIAVIGYWAKGMM